MKKCITVMCVCLLIFMVACTGAQIVSTIETSIQLISSILPLISSSLGLSTTQTSTVLSYLQESNTALDQVNSILQQGGSDAVVAAKITAALSAVVASTPNLTGLPASIVSTVQQIAANLASILQTYGSKPKLAASGESKEFKLSSGDLKKLKACHDQFVTNQLSIANAQQKR